MSAYDSFYSIVDLVGAAAGSYYWLKRAVYFKK